VKTFWENHKKTLFMILLVLAALGGIALGLHYSIHCWQDGGWLFSTGGKSGTLCMTPDGVRWPWDYWGK